MPVAHNPTDDTLELPTLGLVIPPGGDQRLTDEQAAALDGHPVLTVTGRAPAGSDPAPAVTTVAPVVTTVTPAVDQKEN